MYPTEYIFTTANNNVLNLENCAPYRSPSPFAFTRCQHPSVLTDSQQCDPQLPSENSTETVRNGRILFRFAMITNITCVEFCYHAVQDPQDPYARSPRVGYYNESDGYEPWRGLTSSMSQGSHRLHFDISSRTHNFHANISAKKFVFFNIRGNSTLRLKEVNFIHVLSYPPLRPLLPEVLLSLNPLLLKVLLII